MNPAIKKRIISSLLYIKIMRETIPPSTKKRKNFRVDNRNPDSIAADKSQKSICKEDVIMNDIIRFEKNINFETLFGNQKISLASFLFPALNR